MSKKRKPLEHPSEIVMKIDPKLKRNEEAFIAAMFLVAMLQVGPTNVKKIKEHIGMPLDKAKEYMKICRAQGIVKNGKINADWLDKKEGTIAFWMDVAALCGWVKRV